MIWRMLQSRRPPTAMASWHRGTLNPNNVRHLFSAFHHCGHSICADLVRMFCNVYRVVVVRVDWKCRRRSFWWQSLGQRYCRSNCGTSPYSTRMLHIGLAHLLVGMCTGD